MASIDNSAVDLVDDIDDGHIAGQGGGEGGPSPRQAVVQRPQVRSRVTGFSARDICKIDNDVSIAFGGRKLCYLFPLEHRGSGRSVAMKKQMLKLEQAVQACWQQLAGVDPIDEYFRVPARDRRGSGCNPCSWTGSIASQLHDHCIKAGLWGKCKALS